MAKVRFILKPNAGFKIIAGIVSQTALVTLQVYAVIRDVQGTLISAVINAITIYLRRNWWDKLEE